MSKDSENKEVFMAEASYNNFGDLIGGSNSLLEFVKPNKREDIIEKSRDYVWSIGLLFRIIKLKVEFASAGLEPIHEDKKIEDYYKKLYKKLNIDLFARSAAFEHEVVGEWSPYYSWDGDEPSNIIILNPKLVEVKSVLGNDFIYLKPSKIYQQMMNSSDEYVKKELKKLIPYNIYNQWRKGKSARLTNEQSNRYVNLKAYHEQYSHSPIEPIFGDLEILKTLQEADYATAKKLKQLLLQIKVGGENYNNGDAVGKGLLKAVKKSWNQSADSQSMEWFTQWFVDAEYIIPDMEIFSAEKYEGVLKRIIDWSGINVMVEQGGSYSQGYIKIKGLRQAVANTRETIKDALDDFNRLIAKKQGLTYYGNLKVPRIKFNNNALKDDGEIRETVQFLYKYGLLSEEDTLGNFNYDFKRQMRKKKEGSEHKDEIRIYFEPGRQELSHLDNKSNNNPDSDRINNQTPRP